MGDMILSTRDGLCNITHSQTHSLVIAHSSLINKNHITHVITYLIHMQYLGCICDM